MTDKLGVDDIVGVAKALGDTVTVLASLSGGGALNFMQIIAKAPSVFAAVQEFSTVNYASLLPEYIDIDASERPVIEAAFATHLKLSNLTGQELVVAGFDLIIDAQSAFAAIGALVKTIGGMTKPAVAA